MTNNFGCYSAIVVMYIILAVYCVPKHDESYDSVIELGTSTSVGTSCRPL
jgi:hypothetical protein